MTFNEREAWMTEDVKQDCQRKVLRAMSDIYELEQRIAVFPNDLSLRTKLAETKHFFEIHQSILQSYNH